MRKFLFAMMAASLLIACNNKKSDKGGNDKGNDSNNTVDNQTPPPPPPPGDAMLGSYVGAFGDNKITFLVTKAANDSIEGRSIVGGNDRPFKGTFTYHEGIYNAVAKEPGDHKDDGVFTFHMTKANLNQVTGSWKPNDTKRPAKEYTLEKKKFEYRTDVGSWPETSQRLMKDDELSNMYKEDLEMMRNEIFARHGYCFSKKHLRQQFEMEDWYVPNTIDIKGYLTEVEKKNIALIKRYEKYAEEYGDEYGR